MGRLLGGEHASTPQSGVEALACYNGASPDCIVVVVVVVCCCCVVVVVVVLVVVWFLWLWLLWLLLLNGEII